MKNIFVLISLLLLTNCQNYHKTSFKHLNEAFKKWYYIVHPDNYLHLNKNNLFRKYDLVSTNDYIHDLKRFILELSQINRNKLPAKFVKEYEHIKYTIDELLFNVEYVKLFEINCSFYIDNILNKLQLVYDSNILLLSEKRILVSNIINDSYSYIDKSKIIINNSRNIKDLENKVDDLVMILNKIDILFDMSIYDSDFSTIILKYDIFLHDYVDWIKENIKNTSRNNSKDLYQDYFNHYIHDDSDYDKIKYNLNNYINKSFIDLFNISLNYYLIDNDEPIWVDHSDSSNVIRWVLNNKISTNKSYECKYNIFNKIENNKFNLNVFINNISCYNFNQNYINNYIRKKINDISYNKNVSNYTNRYQVNAISNIVNDSIINTYFDKNDGINEILFYLNLYHRYKEIYYQDAYFKSSDSIEDIKTNISVNCFFDDVIKETNFYEDVFSPYYYKLNEFIIYLNFKKQNHNESFNKYIIDEIITGIN